jgi:hypothetical protein
MNTSQNVRSTVTNDGVVFLDVGNGNIFNSNPVGARIWLKLLDSQDISAISLQIAAEFNVPIERARTDIEEFVDQLRHHGLISDGSNPLG